MRRERWQRTAAIVGIVLVAAALPLPTAGAQVGRGTTVLVGDPAGYVPPPSSPIGFPLERAYPEVASDRYELASGCWELRTADGRAVSRTGDGFDASATAGGGEPLHLRAADLGAYLLWAGDETLLAAAPALPPGGSSTVTAEPTPSENADWVVDELPGGGFTIQLPATDEALTWTPDGTLALVALGTDVVATSSGLGADAEGPPAADVSALGDASRFAFHATDGCATWPEPQVNVTGAQPTGVLPYDEVRGHLDAHVHMMAFEFIGGEIRCGRPWHRWGVTVALVDCPDHATGGPAEAVLNSPEDAFGHDTVGWPTFVDWPAPRSLTHEQMYVTWLERTWRGGLRVMVNLLVDNETLCEVYPLKRNACDETATMRLEARRIRELERYVDAQWGGPGKGWFRIVDDPFEARRTINEGRLAVVLGIETSEPFGCTLRLGMPECDEQTVVAHLDEFQALGVSQMELLNKYDNAFAGVTGDGGSTGPVTNAGNAYTTGSFIDFETCPEDFGEHRHDKEQPTLSGSGDEGFRPLQDALFGDVGGFLPDGVQPVPAYPSPPHCNTIGLLPLGEFLLDEMMRRGMLIDPDHMSTRARQELLDHVGEAGYRGLISSHSWSDRTVYEQILRRGGIVTPYAGDSLSFAARWAEHRTWADDAFFFGFGFGADTNGFGGQGTPRGADAENPVTYPFTGFGGVTVDQQVSGERVYDVNVDGVAHYGLYVDWIEDLRRLAGDQLVADMERGPEAYLQVWERAQGIQPDRCRVDATGAPGTDVISVGMPADDVVRAYGQPTQRVDNTLVYCVPEGGGTASQVTVLLDGDGRVAGATATGPQPAPTPTDPTPQAGGGPDPDGSGQLPATGAGLGSLAAGLVGVALLLRHGSRSGAVPTRRREG